MVNGYLNGIGLYIKSDGTEIFKQYNNGSWVWDIKEYD